VRILLESFQIMLLACLYELKMFATYDAIHIVSLIYASIVLLLSIGLLTLLLVEWIRSKNNQIFKKQTHFNEVFAGTKQSWWARSYSFLNYSRKALLVI